MAGAVLPPLTVQASALGAGGRGRRAFTSRHSSRDVPREQSAVQRGGLAAQPFKPTEQPPQRVKQSSKRPALPLTEIRGHRARCKKPPGGTRRFLNADIEIESDYRPLVPVSSRALSPPTCQADRQGGNPHGYWGCARIGPTAVAPCHSSPPSRQVGRPMRGMSGARLREPGASQRSKPSAKKIPPAPTARGSKKGPAGPCVATIGKCAWSGCSRLQRLAVHAQMT